MGVTVGGSGVRLGDGLSVGEGSTAAALGLAVMLAVADGGTGVIVSCNAGYTLQAAAPAMHRISDSHLLIMGLFRLISKDNHLHLQ